MESVKYWAICHTDGGKHEPCISAKHIYPTKVRAQFARDIVTFKYSAKEYYPILEVEIKFVKG